MATHHISWWQVAWSRVGEALKTGEWVTRSFGWLYMMISRLAGPVMTIAVGYLIVYAIESRHGLATTPTAPTLWDLLASGASDIINVTPELVFPGVVVLCIQAGVQKRWAHSALYGITGAGFAVLTLVLLHAFQTNGMDDAFLAAMLLWRTISALFYTVVAEVCSHHSSVQSSPVQPVVQLQPVQSPRNHQVTVKAVRLTKKVNPRMSLLNQVNQVVAEEPMNPSSPMPAPVHKPVQKAVHAPVRSSEPVQPVQGSVNHQDTEPLLHVVRKVNPEPPEVQSEPSASSVTPSTLNHQEKQSEPGDKGSEVQRFIAKQLALGKKPTLTEIMDACQCSKNTAIKHRRAMCGDEDRQPKLSIVNK